jgi:hypothetical protein
MASFLPKVNCKNKKTTTMKNYLLTFSITIISMSFSTAQETIKDATIKTAAAVERKDTIATPQQQEPAKKDAKADKKESKSEGQNKMAINEQGVNKTKPKARKSSTSSTDTTKSTDQKKK